MLKNESVPITEAEWEVMRVIWANENVLSRDIIEILFEKKRWKPATVKTLLGRLVDKGAIETETKGNKYIYSAIITEDACMSAYTEEILSRVCIKQSSHVIYSMIKRAKLSKSSIAELKELLAEKNNTALEEVPCECVPGQCECHLH
ncbi:MAG: CopY/TcrY family copper transport repressor [Alkalibacterium sp.]|nr:CopY/TcrY family copper transport repressor [Alkalibacterium sp.]